jgi:hypothetical protein
MLRQAFGDVRGEQGGTPRADAVSAYLARKTYHRL